MTEKRKRTGRHFVILPLVAVIVYVVSYVVVTRVMSPKIATPLGTMIAMGIPKNFGSGAPPAPGENFQNLKRKTNVLRSVYAPLIWIDQHITGVHIGSSKDLYGP